MVNMETCKQLLRDYNYSVTDKGIKSIINTWLKSKGNLIEKLRKHPNWDEDAMAIIFKNEYDRKFNVKALDEFTVWAIKKIQEMRKSESVTIESFYGRQVNIQRAQELFKEMDQRLRNLNIHEQVMIDGYPMYLYLQSERKAISNEEEEWIREYNTISRDYGIYIHKNKDRKYNEAIEALNYIADVAEGNIVTDTMANGITNRCSVHCVAGQKLSRVINAICKTVGLDKYEETDYRGRKCGYNHHFAILGNEINPLTYKRITVISVNPLDYWTMSFGKEWASCHTIDKENLRGVRNNHYEGCYSSGTESYMLDESSLIYYVIDENYEGKEYWKQDKINRCVFAVNEDGSTIMESRVYPDGRDGGDDSLAGQFRTVMQRVVSDCFEITNYWKNEKGIDICADYIISNGTHYRDYLHYSDCNISTNKDMTPKKIYIGHYPICPSCGCEHEKEDNIQCDDCLGEYTCDRCGDRYCEEDDIYVDGQHFCCEDCANARGYYHTSDDGEYHHERDLTYCESDGEYHLDENCTYDDYTHEYFYGEPEVTTEDGNTYETEDNAIYDGYERDGIDDCWYRRDEMEYDEYEDMYFMACNAEVEVDGNYFASDESAVNAGYNIDYYSREWMNMDDMLQDEESNEWFDPENSAAIHAEDGNIFMTECAARRNGYIKLDSGEWVLEESEVSA